MFESWATWSEYPNYEVSTEGRVRNRRTGKILRPWMDKNFYCMVTLRHKDGSRKKVRVARFVLGAFHGYMGEEANHINGDKQDNALANLEWTDRAGIAAHASRMGLVEFGERHHAAKLTPEDVKYIRYSGKSCTELAAEFNVAPATIRDVIYRKTWGWLQ